jgi:putative ABC transport system ATP-binding protein
MMSLCHHKGHSENKTELKVGYKGLVRMAFSVSSQEQQAQVKPEIQLFHVSKAYGDYRVQAVRNVSLAVTRGEFVALMGPSGCGKSTLLNLIGAIDQPTSGQILLGELDLASLPESERTRIRRDRMGYIFQFFNLLSTLTVEENIALPLELGAGLKNQKRERQQQTAVRHLLEKVGMAHRAKFYPAQLSGGEMQRVAIARALIHEPEIILADEPTGNLDTENGEMILTLLTNLCRENGQTVLMATHSADAAANADRVVFMRDGKLTHPTDTDSDYLKNKKP